MNRDEALRWMDDYLEGSLPDDIRIAFEAYLLTDPETEAEVERLRALARKASALPEGIAPRRDLWPVIEGRITRTERISVPESALRSVPRPVRPWRPLVSLAAVALLALVSVYTARVVSDGFRGESGISYLFTEVRSALVDWLPSEEEYLWVMGDLDGQDEEWQARIPEVARDTLLENLRILDEAIASSRLAVEENPTDPALHARLSDVYQTKIELLQWAAQIISLN